tara:strand:+ start:163480 stop:163683 length:204 start_codon:yes stop_codon:yes gene_type:complete
LKATWFVLGIENFFNPSTFFTAAYFIITARTLTLLALRSLVWLTVESLEENKERFTHKNLKACQVLK